MKGQSVGCKEKSEVAVCGCIRREWCSKYVNKERLKSEMKEAVYGGVNDWRFVCAGDEEEEPRVATSRSAGLWCKAVCD
jgi:hypothetical protein